MSEEIVNKNKSGNGAYIVIILLLLGAIGFFGWKWSSVSSELAKANDIVERRDQQMKEMNTALSKYLGNDSKDLRANFTKMISDYDQLMEMGTPEQNEKIAAQKARIEQLIEEMDSNKKMSIYSISKLKRENDELRDIMRGYVYEIDSLNTLNLSLRNDLDVTTTELQVTTEDRNNLKVERDDLNQKVKEGQKLDVAKGSFVTNAMKQTITNNYKETNKAKNVVQIESSFTIAKNRLTDAGSKTVYMQIVGPDKKTLQNTLSGVVETENGNVAYSNKRTIDYQNQSVDVAMFYSVRDELSKGTYTVRIYCQGQLIGTDSFTLK
ncbi:MAG: hypothetical protein Crog4KO_15820 [Crocinitomicaceae bacterium]